MFSLIHPPCNTIESASYIMSLNDLDLVLFKVINESLDSNYYRAINLKWWETLHLLWSACSLMQNEYHYKCYYYMFLVMQIM